MAIIQARKLSKVFDSKGVQNKALNEIDLTIDEGEFVAIMGPSGCGKSTLINILGLLDNPTSGEYVFYANSVAKMPERKRTILRKGTIGFIFQNFNLIEELSVYENIELPLVYQKLKVAERRKRIFEAMDKLQITARRNHYPNQLSGGQQQRVAIARALVINPSIILADEPTGNLDSANGLEVMEILTLLNQKGTTIIMVTHSQTFAEKTHRIIHMLDGKIVSEMQG